VKRVVSSLSLDGKRLTAEISVEFVRQLNMSMADAIGDQVYSIVDTILSEQIVQSRVPISAADVEQKALIRLGSTASKISAIHVTRLKVGSHASDATLRSQQGAPQSSQTPASMPASGTRSAGASAQSSSRLPAVVASPSGAPATNASSAHAPMSQSSVPSVKTRRSNRPPPLPPSAGKRSSRRPPPLPGSASSTSTPRASNHPSPRTSNHPPTVRSPSTLRDRYTPASAPSSGAARQGAEGHVDWASEIERVGAFHGHTLREAAAYALVSVLANAHNADKFAIFENRGPSKQLRQETAACFAGAVYTAARGAGAVHKDAVGFVNGACRHAALLDPPPPTDVGRYISSPHPAEELAMRMAELLGGENDGASFTAALSDCHDKVAARLRESLATSAR
jgi:hypothetical protein